MRSQSRARPSLFVALCLLAAGCGEQEDVSPSFEDRVPLALDLRAVDRTVVWGERVELTGKLSQGGDPVATDEVVLEADPFPFEDDFAEVAAAESGSRGEFSFAAEPDANTEYRVAAGELSEATSDPVRVLVEPRVRLVAETAGNGTRFTTVFRHPEERPLQGSTVFAYAAPAGEAEASGKLSFVRTERVEADRPGVSSASVTLPFSRSEVRYGTCESYTPAAGMSGPRASCPQTRIAVR